MQIDAGFEHATAHHEKFLLINQEEKLMQTHKFLLVIIMLTTVKNQIMWIS
jgi:hypothetical protein